MEAPKAFPPEKKARLLEVQRLAHEAEEDLRIHDFPAKVFHAVIDGDAALTQQLREEYLKKKAVLEKLQNEERPLYDEYVGL